MENRFSGSFRRHCSRAALAAEVLPRYRHLGAGGPLKPAFGLSGKSLLRVACDLIMSCPLATIDWPQSTIGHSDYSYWEMQFPPIELHEKQNERAVNKCPKSENDAFIPLKTRDYPCDSN